MKPYVIALRPIQYGSAYAVYVRAGNLLIGDVMRYKWVQGKHHGIPLRIEGWWCYPLYKPLDTDRGPYLTRNEAAEALWKARRARSRT